MLEGELRLKVAGEEVVALGERALLWPKEGVLFVADVHFGKDATFRQAMRFVPPGTTGDDLKRLSGLIEKYKVQRLVVLGDAFHSEHAAEEGTFAEIEKWRDETKAAVTMVKGNHDRHALATAEWLGFALLEEGSVLGPWELRHHPVGKAGSGYVLCGHIHPVVRARGGARQSLRMPCFWIGEEQMVLPAFGGFTGGGTVRPRRGDRVILVADRKLVDSARLG